VENFGLSAAGDGGSVMEFLWELKLYKMATTGFRVVIKGDGKTVTRDGPTVEAAYNSAEVQFVRKPPFVPFK
jgi:hypothetical protein